jgi:Tfp pilus assembly protein PilN
MNDINLLRPLILQQQEKAQSRGRSSFYITFTIILLLIIAGVIFGTKFYLSSQSKSLDSQISSSERDLSDVKSIEDKINTFNTTITQLKSLDKNKLTWSTIYDNIAKSTPSDVQLTQVTLVSTAATGAAANTASSSSQSIASASASSKLKIVGVSKSRRSIALFQDKLQKVGGNFVTVDIISSKEITSSQTASTTNQLTPEEEAAKVAAGKGTTQAASATASVDFEIDITLKSS